MIIGEAYGEAEAREQTPFIGPAGWHLTQMLTEAGINRTECYLTNVFNIHPPGNDITYFCGTRADALPGYPYLTKGLYVQQAFGNELKRLARELLDVDPNLILALGNTALWALCGATGISKIRGTLSTSSHTVSGFKVLPTYHPAAIMRQWELRAVTVLDMAKAKRESAFPEVIRPMREIWIEPTLGDIDDFYSLHVERASRLAVDIETSGREITCIGFSPKASLSLVIPFYDARRAGWNYWPTLEAELGAWKAVARMLDHPSEKVFQNGSFDISFLWRSYGLRVRNPVHDTLLLHHALYPESPKALDFLGSVYTNEAAWKLMRKHKQTIKSED